MKKFYVSFLVFCCTLYFGQQTIKKDSISFSIPKKIEIGRISIADNFLPKIGNLSDENKNIQMLMQNSFNFNHSTADIFTTAPKSAINPYGTTNKANTLINGTFSLLRQLIGNKQ